MKIKRNPPISRGFWAPFWTKWRYNDPKEYKPCFLPTGRGNLSKFCGRVAVAKFWSRRRRIRKNGVANAHQLRQAARASAVLAAKYRTFCEKLRQKWGTVADRGQTIPAASTPRAGNSHPVGALPPPHSNIEKIILKNVPPRIFSRAEWPNIILKKYINFFNISRIFTPAKPKQ